MAKKLMVRVRPGVELTCAIFAPSSELIRLDLPTLERPRKAISGGPGAGKCSMSVADLMNFVVTFTHVNLTFDHGVIPTVASPTGRCLQPASSDGGICSAQTAAGAEIPRVLPPQQSKTGIVGDPGPVRKLTKTLANNGPLGMTT